MTDREIERSKREHASFRYWMQSIVLSGTPSRLGRYKMFRSTCQLWDEVEQLPAGWLEVEDDLR